MTLSNGATQMILSDAARGKPQQRATDGMIKLWRTVS